MDREKLVKIGKIIAPHGVRGLVKIKSYTDTPSALAEYSDIYDKSGEKISVEVKSANKDMLIAYIENVESREDAEEISKTDLYITRDSMPALEEDDFYIEDLVGMQVMDNSNGHVGEIIDVRNFGAGDVLEIKFSKDGKKEYVAFTKKNFPTVDVTGRFVKINLF